MSKIVPFGDERVLDSDDKQPGDEEDRNEDPFGSFVQRKPAPVGAREQKNEDLLMTLQTSQAQSTSKSDPPFPPQMDWSPTGLVVPGAVPESPGAVAQSAPKGSPPEERRQEARKASPEPVPKSPAKSIGETEIGGFAERVQEALENVAKPIRDFEQDAVKTVVKPIHDMTLAKPTSPSGHPRAGKDGAPPSSKANVKDYYWGSFIIQKHHVGDALDRDDFFTASETIEEEGEVKKLQHPVKYRTTDHPLADAQGWLDVSKGEHLKTLEEGFESAVPHGRGELLRGWSAADYSAEIKGDRLIGNFYHGLLSDDKRQATLWYANGNKYEGIFKDGIPDPARLHEGLYEYENGDKYKCELLPSWKRNEEQVAGKRGGRLQPGWGTYWYANGDVYEGQFRNDRREGVGTHWYASDGKPVKWEERYEGEWQGGEMYGWGTFYFASGKVEYGAYVNGEPARVTVRYSADRKKAWKFKDGKMEEQISLEVARTLCGQMRSCNRWGHPSKGKPPPPVARYNKDARLRFDGDRYQGETVDGEFEGEGTYEFASGNRYIGQWRESRKEGRGKMIYTDGSSFEGEFSGDRIEGRGIFRYAGGDYYEGEFKAGRREGLGNYWYANGALLQSAYLNGNPVGKGVWWSPDRVAAGRLLDGELVEPQGVHEAAALAQQIGFVRLLALPGDGSDARTDPPELRLTEDRLRRSGDMMLPTFGDKDTPEAVPALPPRKSSPEVQQTPSPTSNSSLVIFG